MDQPPAGPLDTDQAISHFVSDVVKGIVDSSVRQASQQAPLKTEDVQFDSEPESDYVLVSMPSDTKVGDSTLTATATRSPGSLWVRGDVAPTTGLPGPGKGGGTSNVSGAETGTVSDAQVLAAPPAEPVPSGWDYYNYSTARWQPVELSEQQREARAQATARAEALAATWVAQAKAGKSKPCQEAGGRAAPGRGRGAVSLHAKLDGFYDEWMLGDRRWADVDRASLDRMAAGRLPRRPPREDVDMDALHGANWSRLLPRGGSDLQRSELLGTREQAAKLRRQRKPTSPEPAAPAPAPEDANPGAVRASAVPERESPGQARSGRWADWALGGLLGVRERAKKFVRSAEYQIASPASRTALLQSNWRELQTGSGEIRMVHILFPGPEDRFFPPGPPPPGAPSAKQLFRQLSLQWHPDKFQGRFGARLAGGERARIVAAVQAVFQRISAEYALARAREQLPARAAPAEPGADPRSARSACGYHEAFT